MLLIVQQVTLPQKHAITRDIAAECLEDCMAAGLLAPASHDMHSMTRLHVGGQARFKAIAACPRLRQELTSHCRSCILQGGRATWRSWHSMAWHNMAQHGVAQHSMAWHSMAWLPMNVASYCTGSGSKAQVSTWRDEDHACRHKFCSGVQCGRVRGGAAAGLTSCCLRLASSPSLAEHARC